MWMRWAMHEEIYRRTRSNHKQRRHTARESLGKSQSPNEMYERTDREREDGTNGNGSRRRSSSESIKTTRGASERVCAETTPNFVIHSGDSVLEKEREKMSGRAHARANGKLFRLCHGAVIRIRAIRVSRSVFTCSKSYFKWIIACGIRSTNETQISEEKTKFFCFHFWRRSTQRAHNSVIGLIRIYWFVTFCRKQ